VHHQQPEYIMAMLSKFLINLTNDSD
jgi:hypothetical protein